MVIIFMIIFIIVLTQSVLILKKLLIKIDIQLDLLSKDKEEIKLKILDVLEEFFTKLKNFISAEEGGEKDASKKEKT